MLASLVRYVFSIEHIFVIYLFTGFIKSTLKVYNINLPVDITLLFALLLILRVIFEIWTLDRISLKNNFRFIYVIFIFIFSALFTLTYTASPEYGYYKAILLLTNLIAFIIPLMVKNFTIEKFFYIFFIYTFIFSSIYLYKVNTFLGNYSSDSPLYAYMGSYLFVGMVLGITLLYVALSSGRYNVKRIALIFVISIMLFSTAARGPLLFSLIILFIFVAFFSWYSLFVKAKLKSSILKYISYFLLCLIIASIIISYYDNNQLFERSLYRFGNFFNSNVEEIDGGRSNIYANTFDFIKEKPIVGYGIGSYGYVALGIDGRAYPHNLFLEVWFELGIIGLLIISYFMAIYLKRLILYGDKLTWGLSIFVLFNLMKAYSLTDLRLPVAIFSIVLLLTSTHNILTEKYEHNEKN